MRLRSDSDGHSDAAYEWILGDEKAAFAAGMNEHIAKPIQIAKLMDVIGKMVLA